MNPIPELKLEIRNVKGRDPKVLTPEGIKTPTLVAKESGDCLTVTLCNVGVYAVIVI